MAVRQLTDDERKEVYDTMLKRIAQDHPAWRSKHKRRFAEFLTCRFAEDYATGNIVAAKEEDDEEEEK